MINLTLYGYVLFYQIIIVTREIKGVNMEKNYALFKKYLPILIVVTVIGLIFSLFTLAYDSYDPATITVDFGGVIPIFWIAFLVISYAVAFMFAFQVKNLHIKRIKKNSSFSKFAALLAAGLITALFLFNFIQFVKLERSLSTAKIVRLIFSIPFIAYLIVGIIPKEFHRKRIEIPKWIAPVSAIGAIAWCISSLFAIYFWTGASALPTTNFFRLTHMFYLALATLFFLSEIGFEMLGKGHKLYVLTATCLFVTTTVITGTIMVANFLGQAKEISISGFEIFVGVALGVYALSRLFAIQYTLKYVMKQQKDGTGRHHHHHHHHSGSKPKVTSTGKSKSAIPEDIDI